MMKTATKTMIQRELEPYIQNDGATPYLNSKVVQEITVKVLANYTNVYCGSAIDENGDQVFTVNSTSSHKKFIEIIIK